MNRFSLEGKGAIVTGASRGIGEAIAAALAEHGANVVIASRKQDALEAVAKRIGPRAHPIPSHAGKEQDCKSLVAEAVKRIGHVDILVNNAGTSLDSGRLIDCDMAAWDKTFEVNLKGYFWMAREVAKHLRERRAPGSIIQVASIAGFLAGPLTGMYAMTKAAILSMTKTLAHELGEDNIRVNAIAPGLVETKMTAAFIDDDSIAGEFVRRSAIRRVATPEEMGGAAVFLASDASSYVTGHTLVLDAGLTVGSPLPTERK